MVTVFKIMSYMGLTVISNSTKRPETIIFNVWRDFGRTGVYVNVYNALSKKEGHIASYMLSGMWVSHSFGNLNMLKMVPTAQQVGGQR